jgi:hypothetical protein
VRLLLIARTTRGDDDERVFSGRWRIKSDAPPPTSHIMTYEPLAGGKGMKINERMT